MGQVPFTLRDEDTPDDWECANNEWDKQRASCMVPQALSDEEIDEILAHQVWVTTCLFLPEALEHIAGSLHMEGAQATYALQYFSYGALQAELEVHPELVMGGPSICTCRG